MKIRILNEKDFQQFYAVRLNALKNCPEAFGSSYEEEKNRSFDFHKTRFLDSVSQADDHFMIGAFDNGEVLVGIVGFRREARNKTRHKAGIWGMYVEPAWRRMGVGRSLLSALLEKAGAMEGVEQVNLAVVSSNASAKKLYQSLGFLTYGVEKNALKVDEKYYDEDLMACRLKKE